MWDRDERIPRVTGAVDWSRWSSIGLGRMPNGWASELGADPLLRRARVVVDLVFGGESRVVVSTAPMELTSRDGRRINVSPDLLEEPYLEDQIEIGSSVPQARSVSVTLPGRLVQAATLIGAGRQIQAVGEISLISDGMTWEERIVFLRGQTSGGIQFGRDDEDVTIELSDPQIHTRQIPSWILDTSRFAELPSSAMGQRVPLVLAVARGIPCPRVASSSGGGTDDFLVGYGELTITAAWLQGAATGSGTTVQTTDDRGLPVTLIRFSPASDDYAAVNVSCRESASDARRLIASIERLLRDFGGIESDRLSERLFSEALIRAPDPGLSTGSRTSPRIVVNEPTRALDYVCDGLLSDYPYISMAWDGAGIGPVVIDHRADPVVSLSRGQYPIAERAEGARYETFAADDLVTSVVVRYDYDPVADAWEDVETRDPYTSTICATAQRLGGGDNPHEDVDAATIGDQSTAAYTADWIVEHRSRPYLDVVVDAYPIAWLLVRAGDPVRWTDDEIGLEDERAIVLGRCWKNGMVELSLRIWPAAWGDVGGGSDAFAARS